MNQVLNSAIKTFVLLSTFRFNGIIYLDHRLFASVFSPIHYHPRVGLGNRNCAIILNFSKKEKKTRKQGKVAKQRRMVRWFYRNFEVREVLT